MESQLSNELSGVTIKNPLPIQYPQMLTFLGLWKCYWEELILDNPSMCLLL